jgi:hypothetical protein
MSESTSIFKLVVSLVSRDFHVPNNTASQLRRPVRVCSSYSVVTFKKVDFKTLLLH